ncbi:hypothetical protein [Dokdonella immobilis]|uniref:hypothetical protein n=1 Tax=Dokdonella immobilis TaxID=578942 RepID=UPI001587A51A|nr:hypothetical protein [Dokdonella immobilis]
MIDSTTTASAVARRGRNSPNREKTIATRARVPKMPARRRSGMATSCRAISFGMTQAGKMTAQKATASGIEGFGFAGPDRRVWSPASFKI